MKHKHTPGPWIAHGVDDDGDSRSIWVSSATNDGRNICRIVDWAGNSEDGPRIIGLRQLEADARLIAAAPALLAACELLAARPTSHFATCSTHKRTPGICDCPFGACRAAIKAARGEDA